MLGHLEPGASGARLGLRRARWCCDNCTKHLLKGGKVGQSINIIIRIIIIIVFVTDVLLKVGDSLDVETGDDKEVEVGGEASLLMAAVKLLGEKTALGVSVNFVRGLKDVQLGEEHMASQLFGKGKAFPSRFWSSLGRELVSIGLLKEVRFWAAERGDDGGGLGVKITQRGGEFLRGREPLFLPMIGQLKTIVNVPEKEKDDKNFEDDSLTLTRPALYWKLVSTRKMLAKRDSIYPHMILEERALLQMVDKKPTNLSHLANIAGVSEARIKMYGNDFLAVIRQHLHKVEDKKTATKEIASEPTLQKHGSQNKTNLTQISTNLLSTNSSVAKRIQGTMQSQPPVAKRVRVTASLLKAPSLPNLSIQQVKVPSCRPDRESSSQARPMVQTSIRTESESTTLPIANEVHLNNSNQQSSSLRLSSEATPRHSELKALPSSPPITNRPMPDWFHDQKLKRDIMKRKIKLNSLFR